MISVGAQATMELLFTPWSLIGSRMSALA